MIQSKSDFVAAARRLQELSNSLPEQAVGEARRLRGTGRHKLSVLGLRGAILIDAGAAAADRAAIAEGVSIFRKLRAKDPRTLGFQYNLANGLSALARVKLRPGHADPNWYVASHAERREARRIFQVVAQKGNDRKLSAQALINLGNELDVAYRWVEAYDSWVEALAMDSSNNVAALSTALMLLRRLRENHSHPSAMHRVTGYYWRLAARGTHAIERIAGTQAAEMAKSLSTFRSTWRPRKLRQIKDDFGRFVARHRLGLVGTIEGLDLRKARWDSLYIPRVSEKVSAGPGVPPIFAMINQLKSDFCAARWTAYISQFHSPCETSVYGDTLDYALYGVRPSILILAQRAALDLLDRVAVCANEYFSLNERPHEISFRTFWRENGGTGPWRQDLRDQIATWNIGLIALAELASDLGEGGLLWSKHQLRNLGTHRFCVLHDLGNTPSRPSPAVEHHKVTEFLEETFGSLRVARSAILYLVDAVAWRERQGSGDYSRFTLEVLPHHYIRGEGDSRW
jgi:hypothetical protein